MDNFPSTSHFLIMSAAVAEAICQARPATWLRLSTGEALKRPLTLNFEPKAQEGAEQ